MDDKEILPFPPPGMNADEFLQRCIDMKYEDVHEVLKYSRAPSKPFHIAKIKEEHSK